MAAPHEILGVDPDASDETVERAYKERVKEVHPDQGGSAAEFVAVRSAYESLVDGDGSSPGPVGEGGPDRQSPPDRATDDAEPDEDPDYRTVEYLNYDVIPDHGWDLGDEDLFEKAARADLDATDHGEVRVEENESLLEAAEQAGYAWPFACRGGACANCAVAMVEGDLSTPVDHILPDELLERGIRLSCVGAPIDGDAKVVFNVKHLPALEELRLPPRPFKSATDDD